jgi:anti-anti-sigma factor
MAGPSNSSESTYPEREPGNVGVIPEAERPPRREEGTVSDPDQYATERTAPAAGGPHDAAVGMVSDPDLWRAVATVEGERTSEPRLPPKVESRGNVTVLTFTAHKRDLEDMLGSELHGRTDGLGGSHLLLDFANVKSLGSLELGTLVSLHKKLRAAAGRLTLFNVSPEVYEVFEVTRLHTLLTICREAP